MSKQQLIAAYFPFTLPHQGLSYLKNFFDQIIFLRPIFTSEDPEEGFIKNHTPSLLKEKTEIIKKYQDEVRSWLHVHKGSPVVDLAKAGVLGEVDQESKQAILGKLRDVQKRDDKTGSFSDIKQALLLVLAEELDKELLDLGSYQERLEILEKGLDESLGKGLPDMDQDTSYDQTLISPLKPVEFLDYSIKTRIRAWLNLWAMEPVDEVLFLLTDHEAVIDAIASQFADQGCEDQDTPLPLLDMTLGPEIPVDTVKEKLCQVANIQDSHMALANNTNKTHQIDHTQNIRIRVYNLSINSEEAKDSLPELICLVT